jgi:hypothetical protein
LHAVAPHAYAPQLVLVSLHAPAPSQVLGCVSLPALHVAPPHAVPDARG